MSGRSRLIISIVLAVVIVAATFFFLVKPKRDELGEVRDQVALEEQRTTQLRSELSRLEALQENAPKLEAQLAELSGFVPENHQLPNFIFLVQSAANKSGVGFVEITPELPKSPPEGAQVAEVRVTIGASGGYFSIQDFARRLYDLDRALRIDVLSLNGAVNETNELEIELTMAARIFFTLPEGATVGTTDTTGTTTTTPGSSPTEAPPTGLETEAPAT